MEKFRFEDKKPRKGQIVWFWKGKGKAKLAALANLVEGDVWDVIWPSYDSRDAKPSDFWAKVEAPL